MANFEWGPPSAVARLISGLGGWLMRDSYVNFNPHEHNFPARSAKIFFSAPGFGGVHVGW